MAQLQKDGIFVFPELVKDAEDIDSKQKILRSENDTYRTGNVMGYLGYRDEVNGDQRLVIASRFSGENNDFLFLYLLEKVLDLPNIIDMMTDADYDSGLFNFPAFLFPYYLKNALRKGVFKKYIRREYNDRNLKGTIDIARFIKKGTPFVGNIAYSQRVLMR